MATAVRARGEDADRLNSFYKGVGAVETILNDPCALHIVLDKAALSWPNCATSRGCPPIGPSRLPGLPTSFTEIPVDRLVEVRAWLAQQPGVDAERIGIWGASKGAEFALIAASHYNWINAVAAIVPSDLVWEGWGAAGPSRSSFSFGGKPFFVAAISVCGDAQVNPPRALGQPLLDHLAVRQFNK